jgi:RNA polymerase sigma-70 factor (ECF subfamily)
MLRAWRGLARFDGRSSLRTWLYRIATNTCLDALSARSRRGLPVDLSPAGDPSQGWGEPLSEVTWLEPYPDHAVGLEDGRDSPDARYERRESVELAFVAALQHLRPNQRAVLILREVLGFSAQETADALETTVASVNSALQRARASMRAAYSPDTSARASEVEQLALRKFMQAWDSGDSLALVDLLREDARWAMPPAPLWFDGRAAIARLYTLYPIRFSGAFRTLATAANRQPAAAAYLRAPGDAVFRLVAVHVLRIVDGAIAEVTTFQADMCRAFPLPPSLP